MKIKKIAMLVGVLASVLSFCGCGSDPEITQFKNDLNVFCENVAQLDASINNIDAEADNASVLALGYLDKLDTEFQNFAEMDFPEQYDYLEPLADEAASYMSEAVKSYHTLYESETFDENTSAYAKENSQRAFKRVQVILDVLQGEYTAESKNTSDTNVSDESDSVLNQ